MGRAEGTRPPGMAAARRHPRDEEHRLQCACVRWFRLRWPGLRLRLFAVGNGGRRDAVTGARLKAEGVLPGVADLLLLKPAGGYHGLAIEMKTPAGRQQASQRAWQADVERDGDYRYVVCRSAEDFASAVGEYLAAGADGRNKRGIGSLVLKTEGKRQMTED